MKKKTLLTKVVFAMCISVVMTMTACNKTNDKANESETETSEEIVSIADSDAMGNFAQVDSNGNVYIENEDGSKEYLGKDGEFISEDSFDTEQDNQSETDAMTEQTYTGEYTGLGYKINIMDGWIGVGNEFNIRFSMKDSQDTMNFITITNFENGGIAKYSDVTKDSLTSDFKTAVSEGAYENFEFISSKETKIDGYKALEYKAKLTLNDDDKTLLNITSYVIDDKFGGHLIMISDQNDEIDITDGIQTFLDTIKFQNTETGTSADSDTENSGEYN